MFDRLIRYLPVLDYIRRYHPRRILEVGSGAKGLGEFCRAEFTGVDVDLDPGESPVQNMTFVRALASKLPFADASFDLVVCMDVMEHVPKKKRERVMGEMMRVCFGKSQFSVFGCQFSDKSLPVVGQSVFKTEKQKTDKLISENRKQRTDNRAVIIGFPCGRGAEELSRRMYSWFQKRGSGTAKWMKEHTKFGLPDEKILTNTIKYYQILTNTNKKNKNIRGYPLGIRENPNADKKRKYNIAILPNESFTVCEWLLKLEDHARFLKLERLLFRRARPLAEFFLRRVSFGQCYRKIWVIT